MKYSQYTIRNIPEGLDARLRALAVRRRMSLNKVVVEQLERSIQKKQGKEIVNHDFDDLFGKWKPDPAFDEAMKDMRTVDPRDWQ